VSADIQEPNLFTQPTAPVGGVGPLLRETREKLGRELSVVSATLRIRQPFLEAIEDSRFRDLPGATYAIGFVRGYAEYLGLDGQEIVRRFKQENGDLARGNHLIFPSAVSEGGIPTGALLGFALVAAVVLYFGWHWYQEHEQTPTETVSGLPDRLSTLIHEPVGNGTEIVPVNPPTGSKPVETSSPPASTAMVAPATHEEASPPPVEQSPPPTVSEPSNAPDATPPAAAADQTSHAAKGKDKATKTPPAPPPAAAMTPIATSDNPVEETPTPAAHVGHGRVVLQATEKCWIKVLDAGGKVVSSRLLQPGESFSPPSRPGMTMTVGNAGALKIEVDGKELPSLGGLGMVRHDIPLEPARLLGEQPAESSGDMPAPESQQ
jgi:cytoskeleton protein RodZ